MKKTIITVAFVAAFALTASVAFGFGGFHMPNTVQTNSATNSYNGVSSMATTGGAYITQAGTCGTTNVASGNATSRAKGVAVMNTNVAVHSEETVQDNKAHTATNEVASGAGTGGADISKAHVGGATTVRSGNADSKAKGITVMNTNVSVGCACVPNRPCGCPN